MRENIEVRGREAPLPPPNPIETIAPRRGTALCVEFALHQKAPPFMGELSNEVRLRLVQTTSSRRGKKKETAEAVSFSITISE